MAGSPTPESLLPARHVPLIYFGFAYACLLTAFVVLSFRAETLGGFYYHPRLIAVVHLVTLGFITSAILGALYLVCPLAFRMPLPAGRGDAIAAVSWMIAVSGIASHFWLERYSGLAWAGGLALATPLWLGTRVLAGLRRSPAPIAARLAMGLAIANLYVAGGLGVLAGANKHEGFLPVVQLDAVHAHLHLAAVGFATLMVVGAGYRVLPMVLPSAMPGGPIAVASALVIAGGTWLLAAALLAAKDAVPACALVVLAGISLFLSRVVFMLRNRRPPPSARPRPDLAVVHVLQAFVYLLLAAGLGAYLAFAPRSDETLRAAFAYGVFGLVGFLAQLVVGVAMRLLPMSAWLQSFAAGGYSTLPTSLHAVDSRAAPAATVALWTVGVPAVAGGLCFDRPRLTSLGAAALAVATIVALVSGVRTLRRLRPPAGPSLDRT